MPKYPSMPIFPTIDKIAEDIQLAEKTEITGIAETTEIPETAEDFEEPEIAEIA